MNLASLFSWRPGRLARGTLIVTLGMVTRTIMQAGVFLAIARALRPEKYGALCAVLALAGAMGNITGLGTAMLIVRDTSLNAAAFPKTWGSYLMVWVVSTPVIGVIYLLAAIVVLPNAIPLNIIITIGLSEIGFLPLAASCGHAFQAWGNVIGFSKILIVPVLFRFAAAMLFLFFPSAIGAPPHKSLELWCFLYSATALGAVLYCLNQVNSQLGSPHSPNWKSLTRVVKEGFPFAIGGTALRLYSDIDKTMISRLVSLEVTGTYSAGYRIMDMTMLPIAALIKTATPRFFKAGETGKDGGLSYLRRVLPIPFIYASTIGAALYVGANALPAILGTGYANAVATLQWLAWLPLFSTPRYFLQTSLGTSGHQGAVAAMICIGTVINITVNFWLIPIWSWRGAVIATYFAEGIMILGLSVLAVGGRIPHSDSNKM